MVKNKKKNLLLNGTPRLKLWEKMKDVDDDWNAYMEIEKKNIRGNKTKSPN